MGNGFSSNLAPMSNASTIKTVHPENPFIRNDDKIVVIFTIIKES